MFLLCTEVGSAQGTSGAAPRSCRVEPRAVGGTTAPSGGYRAQAAPPPRAAPLPPTAPSGRTLAAPPLARGKLPRGQKRRRKARPAVSQPECWRERRGTTSENRRHPRYPAATSRVEARLHAPKPNSPDPGYRSGPFALPRGPVPQPAQGGQRLQKEAGSAGSGGSPSLPRPQLQDGGEQPALPSGRNFAFPSSVSTPEPG